MWPMKDGYLYIIVNFGGYHYGINDVHARELLFEWRKKDPDTQCYSNGFFSEKLGKWIGTGKWFPTNW